VAGGLAQSFLECRGFAERCVSGTVSCTEFQSNKKGGADTMSEEEERLLALVTEELVVLATSYGRLHRLTNEILSKREGLR